MRRRQHCLDAGSMVCRTFCRHLPRFRRGSDSFCRVRAANESSTRCRGIHQQKSPRALRVRAVADYFYSLGAVEVHRQRRKHDGPSAISLSTLIEQATWTKQMSGLHWTTLEGMLDNGPFRATISCVDASQFTMRASQIFAMHVTEDRPLKSLYVIDKLYSVYPEGSSCIQSQTL